MNSATVRWALGALALGLVAIGLYASIEFYEEIEESGWSRAARLNPYLAAQQLLERSGVEVAEIDNLAELDRLGGVGTLFFSDGNQVRSPRQLREVLAWLEGGGNVIYSANRVEHADDLLLAEFAVAVDWSDADEAGDGRSLADRMREYNRRIERGESREEASRAFGQEEPPLTEVRFGDDIGTLVAAFDQRRVLTHPAFDERGDAADFEHEPHSWSSSELGVHLLQFEVGDGLLTVVSDPSIWSSARIDRHDHAYLLWLLISTDGSFATLRSVVRATLWQLLLANASALLVALALLVLFAVWRAGARFGRVVDDEVGGMRALGQYFAALAMYLWQRRDATALLAPLRQRIWHRAGLALGEFAGAARERQFALLAGRAGVQPDAVARAFDASEFNETAFVHTVRLLKKIEQSL